MKTIVQNSTNLSKFIFEDDAAVTIGETYTVTPNFNVFNMDTSNSTMHENVTPPDDWIGNKYTFDGTTWTLNPDWTEPEAEDGQ